MTVQLGVLQARRATMIDEQRTLADRIGKSPSPKLEESLSLIARQLRDIDILIAERSPDSLAPAFWAKWLPDASRDREFAVIVHCLTSALVGIAWRRRFDLPPPSGRAGSALATRSPHGNLANLRRLDRRGEKREHPEKCPGDVSRCGCPDVSDCEDARSRPRMAGASGPVGVAAPSGSRSPRGNEDRNRADTGRPEEFRPVRPRASLRFRRLV